MENNEGEKERIKKDREGVMGTEISYSGTKSDEVNWNKNQEKGWTDGWMDGCVTETVCCGALLALC